MERFGPNTKVIFHWIFVFGIIAFLTTKVAQNPFGISILIFLFLLTLALNRTTYLQIDKNCIKVTKKNLLFITTYRKQIDLDTIIELTIKDIGLYSSFVQGQAAVNIFSGYTFYEPRYILKAKCEDKEEIEISLNTQRHDIKRLSHKLKATLKDKFEFVKYVDGRTQILNEAIAKNKEKNMRTPS